MTWVSVFLMRSINQSMPNWIDLNQNTATGERILQRNKACVVAKGGLLTALNDHRIQCAAQHPDDLPIALLPVRIQTASGPLR
jgi:hypothetical protein